MAGLAAMPGCDPGSPAATPRATPNRQQLLALGQEWVQCLRGKGLTRMPDAELTPDGYLSFPPADGYNWKEDLSKRKSIIDACKSIEDRYPADAFRPKAQLSADDLRKLGEYAKCARAHGVPDFPDPKQDGSFDLTGTSVANGANPALTDKVHQACKSIWSGKISISGGGGKK
ncbi:hypothetical protein HH310_37540 [Actinoplanes sp. TBRC 11911]|uniref:hypothetical protein n=1 Tax=Actinoplanes sp. TBRC 11911 TaxID=2729386 RepID=UPI00145C534F|nr:hypothetical protein [Actinoplanes sp. TBRC 11911]NMO56864.1 hypothetical protein [Actinoplanes sp. TBRC 11911]